LESTNLASGLFVLSAFFLSAARLLATLSTLLATLSTLLLAAARLISTLLATAGRTVVLRIASRRLLTTTRRRPHPYRLVAFLDFFLCRLPCEPSPFDRSVLRILGRQRKTASRIRSLINLHAKRKSKRLRVTMRFEFNWRAFKRYRRAQKLNRRRTHPEISQITQITK
jgi:hypothetical protein